MSVNQEKIKLTFYSSPTTPFAYYEGQAISVNQFKSDVTQCVEQLMQSDGEILLTTPGRYAFSVALLACWFAGKTVISPPDKHHNSWQAILDHHKIGFHCDQIWGQQLTNAFSNDKNQSHEQWSVELPSLKTAILLYTSGSTGRPVAIKKSMTNLFCEVLCLASEFDWPKGALVGTVAPQHLYGLTFTVLLPWLLGVPLTNDVLFFPQDVSKAIENTRATTLISVPAHYQALLQGEFENKALLCLSATAPLQMETAQQWKSKYQQQILEIYGSTETGIIGFRHQLEDKRWMAFPGVHVGVEKDLLKVKSAFIHSELGSVYQTADQAKLSNGNRFFFSGRADSIVKIAGKRISLIQIEQALLNCTGVVDAAVIAVGVNGYARDCAVWAAVVGESTTVDIIANIRLELHQKIESTSIPRRIVLVDKLPRNSSGKLMRNAVEELFISN